MAIADLSVKHLDATIVKGRVLVTFQTDSAPTNYINFWDEEYLFSFYPHNLSWMAHPKESEGDFGCRLDFSKNGTN
jgi:hypothetical protein